MYAQVRHLAFAAVFALLALWAAPAAAWIELNPKGLLSTVEVEKDGHATVSHELTLEVRGGPLKQLDFGTSDPDAEILPDATVVRAAGGIPIPLIVERRADGSLGLEVDLPKGLRGGTWLFKVRYRTNLVARDLVRRRAATIELGWVGPRLDAGLDGARAIFRLPPTDVVPRLPTIAADDPDPGFGVMVAAVHHTPAADEIELVRSHVARGEPVLWRVEASAQAIPALAPATSATSGTTTEGSAVDAKSAVVPPALVPRAPARSLRFPLLSGLLALLLTCAAGLKAHTLGRACREHHAAPRPLVRLPVALRAPLAGLLLGAGLIAGSELEEPTLAAFAILLAMALVTERAPRIERAPRGPGRWLSLRDEDAFVLKRRSLPGAYLDSGTLRGLASLGVLVALIVVLALGELTRSPYQALLVVLGGAALMPVFFTGRASELVADRARFSQRFVRDLAKALRARVSAKTVAWGRVPDGSSEPDELRVLIQPKDAAVGLVALETGLDAQRGIGGIVGVPFVIVRAKEGSAAQRALPRGVIWTRGRKADERVAILSPKLPTLGLTLALIERLLEAVADQPSTSRRMSKGRSAFTAKLGTVRSPAHAT